MAIAALSYPGDGKLIVASRDRTVVLGANLDEIVRIVPPYPFDPKVALAGLTYFSFSRDGSIAALGWQSDTVSKVPTVGAGVLFYRVPSGEPVWSSFLDAPESSFEGTQISPDGTTAVSLVNGVLQVSAVADGTVRWSAPADLVPPVQFTADGAGIITAAFTQVQILSAVDGSEIRTFALPEETSWASAAVSADSSTLAVFANAFVGTGTLLVWRLSDGALLATITPPADVPGLPFVLALSPSGDRVAASWVPGGPDALLVWRGDHLLYRVDQQGYQSATFSGNGTVLATANRVDGVVLRNAETGVVFAKRSLSALP
jgi:hypothetical protein